MEKGEKPATRNDLGRVSGRVLGRTDKRFNRVEAVLKRMGKRIIEVQETAAEHGERLKKTMTSDEFQKRMDEYVAKLEIADRSREVRLDMWREHERRVATLENRQAST